MPSLIGIFLSMISGSHLFYQRSALNPAEKAGIYETKAAASKASPVMSILDFSRTTTYAFHLLFSPDNPLTSLSAEDSFYRQLEAFASTSSFLATASSNCRFN